MKHILFVLDYYYPHRGGAENVYHAIISRLAQQGNTIHIITMHFSSKLQKVEHQENITIYRTGKTRKQFMFAAIKKGREILKNEQIDLIHTATYGGAIPARILGKVFRKKVIITVHEIFATLRKVFKGNWGSLPYRWYEHFLFSLPFDHYHCVSRYTMNSLRLVYGIPDKKMSMIYNGIDNDFWNPLAVSADEIKDFRKRHGIWSDTVGLYYGHAGISKGLDYLLAVLVPLLQKNPDMQFICNIIHSKNSDRVLTTLKTMREKYKLEQQLLLFDGFSLENLRTLVASCDFVVAPSLAEGFGSVHAETSTMGKILITTSVAAIPEVVHGKVRFIPPQDSEAIMKAIKDIQEGKYSILESKNFDWTNTVKKIQWLYSTL